MEPPPAPFTPPWKVTVPPPDAPPVAPPPTKASRVLGLISFKISLKRRGFFPPAPGVL